MGWISLISSGHSIQIQRIFLLKCTWNILQDRPHLKLQIMPHLSSVQSLNRVWLFATLCIAAHQASMSTTNSQYLLKLMSIELVMPSHNLSLCHPLLLLPFIFPTIRVFSNELALCISGQSIGVSASALVFPMNIQDWFPLGLTGLISLQSKILARVFSSTKFKSINS